MEMCVDMGADICVDLCVDMCVGMCVGMCADMCVEMCADTRADIRVDMCADMCVDMSVDGRALGGVAPIPKGPGQHILGHIYTYVESDGTRADASWPSTRHLGARRRRFISVLPPRRHPSPPAVCRRSFRDGSRKKRKWPLGRRWSLCAPSNSNSRSAVMPLHISFF